MKISPLEKILLCCAGAAVLLALGYFAGQRSAATPYRVDAQYQKPAPQTSSAPAPTDLVDINTATVAQLAALPGIGEKRAADIVADRTANGPFRVPEDLTRVKGIGEGTLEGLLAYIIVSQ